MRKESIDEMERIRRGLEAYLEEEVYEEDWDSKEWRAAAKAERKGINANSSKIDNQELDIIDLSENHKGIPERELNRNIVSEYEQYEELEDDEDEQDWDSPQRRAARRMPVSTDLARTVGSRQNSQVTTMGSNASKGRVNQEMSQKDKKAKKAESKDKKRRKKKKSRFKRFLLKLAVVLAIFALGINYLAGLVYDKMNYHEIESLALAPLKEDGVVNILLIGNDSRENGEDGRSDAMILLSISSNTKKMYMTSLLRDMYVEIPGHDGNRLNAAYAFGGAELLMETIETNLDIEVNHYVLVNFEAFANLVDAVGGVNLELTRQEQEYVNGYLVEYNALTGKEQGTDNLEINDGGMVHLNGPQALAYTRNRYLGTDFGRTERQRKVLTEVIKGLPKAVLTNPKELIDGLMPNLTTNLTKLDCIRLVGEAAKLAVYDLEQMSIPAAGTYKDATIRGMSVLEVDFSANKEILHKAIYGE